jgi:hypothetical protein
MYFTALSVKEAPPGLPSTKCASHEMQDNCKCEACRGFETSLGRGTSVELDFTMRSFFSRYHWYCQRRCADAPLLDNDMSDGVSRPQDAGTSGAIAVQAAEQLTTASVGETADIQFENASSPQSSTSDHEGNPEKASGAYRIRMASRKRWVVY